MIYYDPFHSESILYNNTDSEEAIVHITDLLRGQYPAAFKSNFRGSNGIQVMEADFVSRFRKEVDQYSGTPLPAPIAKTRYSILAFNRLSL